MNALIGDSRVRDFKVHPLSNLIDDNWSLPGAGVLEMENLIRDSIINHHGEDNYFNLKMHVYISAGICDLTVKQKAVRYQETLFDLDSIDTTRLTFTNSLNYIQNYTIRENAIPIFTTIYPLSLKDWNLSRLRANKTTYLVHEDNYALMQSKLEELLMEINQYIVHLNGNLGMATPLIHKQMIHNRAKGNSTFKFNLLADGCHPNPVLKHNIVKCFAQAISKNRA